MASDLSTLIQDGLCNTLQNLLGIDAKLNSITKVHEKDLLDLELLKIESEFEFEQLTTILSFIVPAHSASLIFNIQMGDTTTEPSLSIDDDTIDAIGEFISTVSGGLTTTINGAELEDLGKLKFSLKGNETLQSNTTSDIENMYKFSINLEDNEITIFILFDEAILPYIADITLKPITEYPEEIIKQDDTVASDLSNEEEEVIENSDEEIVEDKELKNGVDEKSELENSSDDEDSKEDDKPENKKLKMLVMGVGGLLAITIISGIVMYFMGTFDDEPVPVKKIDSNTTKATKDIVSVVKYKTLKKVNFKLTDINTPRLNIRLESLTKYKVLTKDELESQKLAEKNRILSRDKERKLLEFSKKNKEEPLPNNIDNKHEVPQIKEVVTTAKETEIIKTEIIKNDMKPQDTKLKFILANSLKYDFFKKLVIQNETKQARISICNDADGRTTIFIGPFENEELQIKMQNSIKENNKNIKTTISNITLKEFDTSCNF